MARALIAADAVVFAVAVIVYVALLPSNFDNREPSLTYRAAYWIGLISLLVLVVCRNRRAQSPFCQFRRLVGQSG